jgi:hypothetical protein
MSKARRHERSRQVDHVTETEISGGVGACICVAAGSVEEDEKVAACEQGHKNL